MDAGLLGYQDFGLGWSLPFTNSRFGRIQGLVYDIDDLQRFGRSVPTHEFLFFLF